MITALVKYIPYGSIHVVQHYTVHIQYIPYLLRAVH